MKLRKAQAAMEFLITYGWAILIILAAIGALAYFGVMKPGNYLPDRCQFPAGVACSDWRVVPDVTENAITLSIKNSKGQDFINFTVAAAGFPCTPDKDTYTTENWKLPLDDGEERLYMINCTSPLLSGKKFSPELKATYFTLTDNGFLSHTIYGDMTTKVE